MKLTPQKLEGWATAWWQFPFFYDTPVWRTDRRTDGRAYSA